jgi:hypothetical protein
VWLQDECGQDQKVQPYQRDLIKCNAAMHFRDSNKNEHLLLNIRNLCLLIEHHLCVAMPRKYMTKCRSDGRRATNTSKPI